MKSETHLKQLLKTFILLMQNHMNILKIVKEISKIKSINKNSIKL